MKRIILLFIIFLSVSLFSQTIPSSPNTDGSVNNKEMYAISLSYISDIASIHPYTPKQDGRDWAWKPDLQVSLVRQTDGKTFVQSGMQRIMSPRPAGTPKDATYIFFIAPEAGTYIVTSISRNGHIGGWLGLPFKVTVK
jgi:hypothetical protein